jgi:hypothetical protein
LLAEAFEEFAGVLSIAFFGAWAGGATRRLIGGGFPIDLPNPILLASAESTAKKNDTKKNDDIWCGLNSSSRLWLKFVNRKFYDQFTIQII